ncbi:hypothetical protein DV737_g4725, partial [Chaetothyriales sp. CBS 132003]
MMNDIVVWDLNSRQQKLQSATRLDSEAAHVQFAALMGWLVMTSVETDARKLLNPPPRPVLALALRPTKPSSPLWQQSISASSHAWAESSNATTIANAETTEDQASIVVREQKANKSIEARHAKHQPDYNARVDHGTSTFSPVPIRVMDGSEPGDITPAAVLSGAPLDLQARTVRIYKPTKPATQSGTWGAHVWRMDWDPAAKGHRWENPLMGWQSSGDSMQAIHLDFRTKDEAVLFAQKQGYEYYVQEPQQRRFVPKAYANNFTHEPGPLKHIKTK